MFPPLMSYPRKLSFVYIDNQVRELRANCLIVAGTGSGKDSSTKQPLAHIIADMKQRDEENRRRLKEFNDEYNSKAANKQKPQRPDDLIRHADDDMPTSKRGPRSLLDLLPGTFTIDDAKQVRIKLGMDTEKQAIWLAPGKSAIMWYRWQMAVLKKHQYIKHYDYNNLPWQGVKFERNQLGAGSSPFS